MPEVQGDRYLRDDLATRFLDRLTLGFDRSVDPVPPPVKPFPFVSKGGFPGHPSAGRDFFILFLFGPSRRRQLKSRKDSYSSFVSTPGVVGNYLFASKIDPHCLRILYRVQPPAFARTTGAEEARDTRFFGCRKSLLASLPTTGNSSTISSARAVRAIVLGARFVRRAMSTEEEDAERVVKNSWTPEVRFGDNARGRVGRDRSDRASVAINR